MSSACADPGIFTNCVCVCVGGGGGGYRVQAHLTVKGSDNVVLLFLLFLVLTFNLFNSFTEGSDGLFFGKQ